jgi:hypothetical protein
MKPIVNKLKIIKNTRVLTSERHFVYKFEWYNNDTLLLSELRQIQASELNLPMESYEIQELVEHKNICCFTIDINTLLIDEVEV